MRSNAPHEPARARYEPPRGRHRQVGRSASVEGKEQRREPRDRQHTILQGGRYSARSSRRGWRSFRPQSTHVFRATSRMYSARFDRRASALAAFGLPFVDVRQRLRREPTNLSAGRLARGRYAQWRPNSAAQLNDAMGQNWTCLKPRAASRFWQTLRPGTSHDHGWQPRSWERSLQISDCDDTAGQVWGLPLRCHAVFLGSACSQTADDAGTQSVEAR